MAQSDEFLQKVQTDVDLTQAEVGETIRPSGLTSLALDSLPKIPLNKAHTLFGMSTEILGSGGMGTIHGGTQPSLVRPVAIKRAFERGVQALVREAKVMGHLEHPNIVPVHVAARDENDVPYVVMKRIAGTTLLDHLSSMTQVVSMDQHLNILIDIANAVDFAHSKGIVHLDLKPANVMIGEFGEVYVLDWGTACAFRDDAPAEIARVPDPPKLSGTPRYVAPEMFSQEHPIGPATDVYLLGGLLYAIMCGDGPNTGGTTTEALRSAYYPKKRHYPAGYPPELVAIAERALQRNPADRYQTAREFRLAIEDFRRFRGARELVALGHRRLSFAREQLQEDADADVGRELESAREAFEDALGIHIDLRSARDGLQEALIELIEFELRVGHADYAMKLTEHLPTPVPELKQRCFQAVEQAQEKVESLKSDLERLQREVDPRVAGRAKAMMWMAIGLTIAIPQLAPAAFGHRPSVEEVLASHSGFAVILVLIVMRFRQKLASTLTNRVLVGTILAMVAFSLVPRIVALAGQVELGIALGIDLAMVACFTFFFIATVDRRLQACFPGYVAGAAGCFVYPDQAFWVFPTTHLVNMTILAIVYWFAAEPESQD